MAQVFGHALGYTNKDMGLWATARLRVRKLTKALQKLFRDNELVYTCMFTSPPSSRLSQLTVSNYTGLLLFHRINTANQVVAYWQDERYFLAYGASFQRDAGLPAPCFSGTVTEFQQRKERFWKRYSPLALVLSAAALFGALSAIRDYFAVLFAAPEATLSFVENSTLDVVENESIVISMAVMSHVRFASAKVMLRRAEAVSRADPNRKYKLDWDLPILPNLSAGQPQQFKLFGQAPALQQTDGPPDVYDLDVDITAKAGMLWPARQFAAIRELRVWPTTLAAPRPHPTRAQNNFCQMDGIVYVGRPYPQGLDAEIVVTSQPGVVGGVDAYGAGITNPQKLSASQPDSVTQKITFRTPALQKFQTYRYHVILQGGAGIFAEKECQEWAMDSKTLDISFQ